MSTVREFFHGRVTAGPAEPKIDGVLAMLHIFDSQRCNVAHADARYQVINDRARERCPDHADTLIAIVYALVKRDAEDSEYPQCQREAFEEYERLLNGAVDAILNPGFEW